MWIPLSLFQLPIIRYVKTFLDFLILFAALYLFNEIAGIFWSMLFGIVYIAIGVLGEFLKGVIFIPPSDDEDEEDR